MITDRVPTSSLPKTADVVVVGGGVNGASTAFQLAKRGAGRVVLIERAVFGSGATGKSGALVRAHYTNIPETRLTHESMRIFEHWGDLVGHGDPGFDQVGFLRVVAPSDETALRANVEAMRREVGVDTWVVTPAEIREIEPLLHTSDLTAAAFEPRAGYCDPNATLRGFLDAARAHAATAFEQTEMVGLSTAGGRVTGVRTNRGEIATETVVLAPGAYSDRLLAPLGIDLGLVPYRTRVVIFDWPAPLDRTRRHRVVIDSIANSWFRPYGPAGTLIGAEFGDRQANPDELQPAIDEQYVDHVRAALTSRFPVFANASVQTSWTGVWMRSPDSHPIIDKLPQIDGLFLFTGDSGSSFKTSPAIGVCLAEWVLDGAPRLVDLTPFRASRFAEGKPWVDRFAYDEGSAHSIAR